jgi:hypothetical protein
LFFWGGFESLRANAVDRGAETQLHLRLRAPEQILPAQPTLEHEYVILAKNEAWFPTEPGLRHLDGKTGRVERA